MSEQTNQLATFAAGCFWRVEYLFAQQTGVLEATSGYMGGDDQYQDYKSVCTGETGHAEVVQVSFDPTQISYQQLVEFFFENHDPTTYHRQGVDVGSQYRSVIFFHSDEQQAIAEQVKQQLIDSKAFDNEIVTEIVAAKNFHRAEEYHQNYIVKNAVPLCEI